MKKKEVKQKRSYQKMEVRVIEFSSMNPVLVSSFTNGGFLYE